MSDLTNKLNRQAKCLAVAPAEEILKTMEQAAAAIDYQEKEIIRLKMMISLRNDYHEDEIWFWQGNGEDHIASMSDDTTVVLRASDLKEMVQPKYITSEINNVGGEGRDDYDRATDTGSRDDYDRAMEGI